MRFYVCGGYRLATVGQLFPKGWFRRFLFYRTTSIGPFTLRSLVYRFAFLFLRFRGVFFGHVLRSRLMCVRCVLLAGSIYSIHYLVLRYRVPP